jgi:hypothetical protein
MPNNSVIFDIIAISCGTMATIIHKAGLVSDEESCKIVVIEAIRFRWLKFTEFQIQQGFMAHRETWCKAWDLFADVMNIEKSING